jgi:hypothetical protein
MLTLAKLIAQMTIHQLQVFVFRVNGPVDNVMAHLLFVKIARLKIKVGKMLPFTSLKVLVTILAQFSMQMMMSLIPQLAKVACLVVMFAIQKTHRFVIVAQKIFTCTKWVAQQTTLARVTVLKVIKVSIVFALLTMMI